MPYSKVRKCFEGANIHNMEGVVYENGMVGLKKDYFYAGRVDKSVFTIDTISPDDNL